MATELVTVPAAKPIKLNGVRYKVAADTPVPVVLGEPLKQYKNKRRPFGCPVCGPIGWATKSHRGRLIHAVCQGDREAGPGHEPAYFQWLDDVQPAGDDEPDEE